MLKEPTQSNIFHIHIDATYFPLELETFALRELDFVDTDFSGHPEGYVHFEPKRHLTLKLNTKQEFVEVWGKLEKKADECSDFVGYLEGEFIPKDEFIPYKPYHDEPLTFNVKSSPASKMSFFTEGVDYLSKIP